jgi:hypothetical protein
MSLSANSFATDDAARDGAPVCIGSIRPDDKGRHAAFHEHLLAIAHDKGISEITAEELPQSTRMLESIAGSGVPMRHALEEGVIRLLL